MAFIPPLPFYATAYRICDAWNASRSKICFKQGKPHKELRRLLMKSFDQAFSKACAVEAAKASSSSAENEIPLTVFSFVSFFLAPPFCKRKAAMGVLFFKTVIPYAFSAIRGYRFTSPSRLENPCGIEWDQSFFVCTFLEYPPAALWFPCGTTRANHRSADQKAAR